MLQHTVSFHHRPTIPTVFARAPVIHYIFTRKRYSQDGYRGFCQATQTTRLPILCAEQRGTVLIVVLSRPAECRSGITHRSKRSRLAVISFSVLPCLAATWPRRARGGGRGAGRPRRGEARGGGAGRAG